MMDLVTLLGDPSAIAGVGAQATEAFARLERIEAKLDGLIVLVAQLEARTPTLHPLGRTCACGHLALGHDGQEGECSWASCDCQAFGTRQG